MTTSTTGPTSATATLRFSVAPQDGKKAFRNIYTDVHGNRGTNMSDSEHQVVIENARVTGGGKLNENGFELFHRPSKHTAFTDDEDIKQEYYPESIEYLKEITGASKVVIFDHTIRRRRPGDNEDTPDKRQPVSLVHVDQTTASSIARVHRHLPADEAPELAKKRFQIINLWRPISRPAYDWPLTLGDYRSVNVKEDVFPVSLVYPDRQGETMGVKYSPNLKFKYYYGMTPEEFVLIKCFDSLQDGSVSVFTPHTAFADPNTPADAPPRESIEIRALVFYN